MRDPGEPALWRGDGHPESRAGSRRLSARLSGTPRPPGGLEPGGQRGASGRSRRLLRRVSPPSTSGLVWRSSLCVHVHALYVLYVPLRCSTVRGTLCI